MNADRNVNISQQLAAVIEAHHSLAEILDEAARIIAREMAMDACSIFLLEVQDRRLHMQATFGLDRAALGRVSLALHEGLVGLVVSEMRPMAVEHAAAHPAYRYFPETGEDRFASFLGVPMSLRERPVGAVIVQTTHRRSFSDAEVRGMEAISAQLVGIVANARLIEALDRGERAEQALASPAPPPPPPPGQPRVLQGCAASPGIAAGTAVLRGTFELDPEGEGMAFLGEAEERARLDAALEQTRQDILRIQRAAAQEADEEHALIFSSHLLLLNDPVLLSRVHAALAAGTAAPLAVDRALGEFSRQLQAVPDPYIQERVEDILDLRSRLLGHLLGHHAAGTTRPPLQDGVVIASRIPPSLVIEIKTEGARGLITEIGGTTSHGILLARSMGIPVVTGIAGAAGLVRAGEPVIVDGDAGLVMVNPDAATAARYAEAALRGERLRSGYARYRDLPARTADGVRVRLKANISIAAELAVARDNGAEGVGLYRTEFPFILREHFPTREEQVRIYRKAYEVFPQGPINFRILDLGGDKFVPGGEVAAARDPFHGYRSIRVLFDHPQVLRDQVQAFVLVAGDRPLRLMVPMVTSLEELRRVKDLVAAAIAALGGEAAQRAPAIGVMIEVPAAVEIAEDLARETDFLSIGTNDLIQYSLVIDREDSRMASPRDPYHPAILRMLRRVILAGHAAGKPVGVCGELAADPLLAALLAALGVDELSVVPAAIPPIKQALAAISAGALAAAAGGILALSDAGAVRERLQREVAACQGGWIKEEEVSRPAAAPRPAR